MKKLIQPIAVVGTFLSLNACRLPDSSNQNPNSKVSAETSVSNAENLTADLPFYFYNGQGFSEKYGKVLNSSHYNLSFEIFDRKDIAKYQKPGSDLTGTPKSLQGIWWMDGNPISDETVSFATLDFSQAKPLYAVYGENNFSFHGGPPPAGGAKKGDPEYENGLMAYSLAKAAGLAYEFDFSSLNGDPYGHARIIPTFEISAFGFSKRFSLSPSVMEFTMSKVDEHMYTRDNTIGGQPVKGYKLRRILVPSESNPNELVPTQWWDLYAKQETPKQLRMVQKN